MKNGINEIGLKDRLAGALSRARYAAAGAAIGAFVGGLFSRSMASTGAATGALVGAVVGEKRHSAGGLLSSVRERTSMDGEGSDEPGLVDQIAELKDEGTAETD